MIYGILGIGMISLRILRRSRERSADRLGTFRGVLFPKVLILLLGRRRRGLRGGFNFARGLFVGCGGWGGKRRVDILISQ